MELGLFSLECNEVSSSEFWVTMVLAWFGAACILRLIAVFLNCWRISVVCLALKLVDSWVELGISVGIGGIWMSSCRLMFPGIMNSLVFSSLGIKPPASGFQYFSYSSLKTSLSI